MKKLLAMVTVITITCTVILYTPVAAKGKTKVIDIWPTDDITNKVLSVGSGSVILVHTGVYYGKIWIQQKHDITIKAERGTILDGSFVFNGATCLWYNGIILDSSSGITVDGFEIRNFMSSGIILGLADNNLVVNNEISKTDIGISLRGANDNSILKNTITETNTLGIELGNAGYPSNRNIITDNELNVPSIGISIWGNDNQILKNEITTQYDGILIGSDAANNIDSTNNLIQRNMVTSTHIYNSAINLGGAHHNKVIQNEVSDSFYGISIYSGGDDQVLRNDVSNCAYGIFVHQAAGNTLSQNNISGCGQGVDMYGAQNNIVSKNKVTDSINYGIAALASASENQIENNKVSGSGDFDLYTNGAPGDNQWKDNKYDTRNW